MLHFFQRISEIALHFFKGICVDYALVMLKAECQKAVHRIRLGIKNKQVYFVLLSACTIFVVAERLPEIKSII